VILLARTVLAKGLINADPAQLRNFYQVYNFIIYKVQNGLPLLIPQWYLIIMEHILKLKLPQLTVLVFKNALQIQRKQ